MSTIPMRLRWPTTRETSTGAGRLTVTLHSQASGRQLQTIVDAHGVASATVAVADEPRCAYFVGDEEAATRQQLHRRRRVGLTREERMIGVELWFTAIDRLPFDRELLERLARRGI